jgi:hypothetical protein
LVKRRIAQSDRKAAEDFYARNQQDHEQNHDAESQP